MRATRFSSALLASLTFAAVTGAWALEAQDSATESMQANRSPDGGGSHTFENNATITIPGNGTSGPATPYPSDIVVSGPIGGEVVNVKVTLNFLSHSYPDDVDVLLVAPNGFAVLILANACGDADISLQSWRFHDEVFEALPDDSQPECTTLAGTLTVRPSIYNHWEVSFPSPAPQDPPSHSLHEITGNPNGIWSLYVLDDAPGDVGTIAGWTLELETAPIAILIPAAGTSGVADPYPAIWNFAYNATTFGSLLDADAQLRNITHSYPDDLDVLLVAPNGEAVVLVSDVCGSDDLAGETWTLSDDAVEESLPDDSDEECSSNGYHWATNFPPADAWPSPAPAGSFGSYLGIFNGDSAEGDWKLFVVDDSPSDSGFFSRWEMIFRLSGIFRDGFESGGLSVWSSSEP